MLSCNVCEAYTKGRQRCLIFRLSPHSPPTSAVIPNSLFSLLAVSLAPIRFENLPAEANYSSSFPFRSLFVPSLFFLAEPFFIPQTDC